LHFIFVLLQIGTRILFINQKNIKMRINIQHVQLFDEKSEVEIKNHYSKKLKKNDIGKTKKRDESYRFSYRS
jgi:hypothetical protein